MSSAKDIALAAKALLEKGFCKGDLAQDAEDKHVDAVDSPDAVKFCMLGALQRAALDLKVGCGEKMPSVATCRELKNLLAWTSISAANDDPTTTQADVVNWMQQLADRLP